MARNGARQGTAKQSAAFAAMEAKSVESLPEGPEWQYEPKWDGFRCILIRDGDVVELHSKSGESLTRYFPELIESARALKVRRYAIDGEIVIPSGRSFSFDNLLQRIHPAQGRVQKLSLVTPARFIAFDILSLNTVVIATQLLCDRRAALERFAGHFEASGRFDLSVATPSIKAARVWLENAGGGFDGVIAKRVDLPYQSGNREGMQKIKRLRSADCVIGGFRYAERALSGRRVVGSLLLGLYDTDGRLNHVGFSSAIKSAEKPALTDKLAALHTAKSFTGNAPGGPSRWSTKRSSEWLPVKTKLVIEVSYDHFTGGRFRHGTSILRWRPDKKPAQCTMEQLRQKTLDVRSLLKRKG